MGVSENRLNPEKPNGFADHYPYEKWLYIIGKINPTFSDKPISSSQKTEDHEMGMATCTPLVFFDLSSEWFVSYTTIVGNKFHNGTPITLTKVETQKSNIIQEFIILMFDGCSSFEYELFTPNIQYLLLCEIMLARGMGIRCLAPHFALRGLWRIH